jgi:hypothetical protein
MEVTPDLLNRITATKRMDLRDRQNKLTALLWGGKLSPTIEDVRRIKLIDAFNSDSDCRFPWILEIIRVSASNHFSIQISKKRSSAMVPALNACKTRSKPLND